MRVFANEKKIAQRARLGKYVSWAGLAVLAVGMLIVLRNQPPNEVRYYRADQIEDVISSVERNRNAVVYAERAAFDGSAGTLREVPTEGLAPDLALLVSPDNDWIGSDGLSGPQVAALFTGVNETAVAADPAWPNRPVSRISAEPGSAAYEQFIQSIMVPVYGSQEAAETALQKGTENNYVPLTGLSFLCLILGFIASNVGGNNMRRFGRSPRPDEMVAAELKGFDDRYTLYNWMLPAPYVLAGPSGIYTFAVRDQGGAISNEGNRWKQPFSLLRLLTSLSQAGLGNPTVESQTDAEKVRKYIRQHMPEVEVDVQPMVLFLHPQVNLTLKNPEVPVVQPKGLKALLRQRGKQTRMDSDLLNRVQALFEEAPK